jgi:hypothetical protein
MLQMRRSRGAFSGFLLVLLGLWGALVPLIGPYFHYAYTPDVAWHYDTARLWLEILPGAAVVLGGLMLMISTGRHTALFGGLLAAASGAWFVLGTTLSLLWNNYVPQGGSPASSQPFMRVMEQLGFFYALGVVIVLIAGVAIGRILSVPSGIREVEPVAPVAPVPVERVPADTVPVARVGADTAPVERVTAEPTRFEKVSGDAVRTDAAQTDAARTDAARTDAARTETAATEDTRPETVRTDTLPRRDVPAEDTQTIS